jgi:hypothetical protein
MEGTMHKKHSLPTCAGIVLTLLFWGDAKARADVSWSYNWEPSTTKVYASNISSVGPNNYLSVTNEPDHTATGNSNTVITNIQAVSTATSQNPAQFNDAPISFTLKLTDSASNIGSSLMFSGFFHGTITATSANVGLTFTSPTTETVALGGNQYQVVVGSYTPPGPPGITNSGSLNAFVTVTPLNNGGGHTSGSGTPEPAALTLACLAFPFVGLYGWRRRRANEPQA